MNLFLDTYASYGLSENPFLVHALEPDERGLRLLIGRDTQIQLVAQKLHKHGKITCLDGHVGVGKTSLVNVAAYLCHRSFDEGKTTQLLLPMSESFQLSRDEDANAFCALVFRRVAQTLLKYREKLRAIGDASNHSAGIAAWLNAPIVEHINGAMGVTGTVGVPGAFSVGGTAGTSSAQQVNTSDGFSAQGFELWVKTWLEQLFTVQGNGGVVCVIDNLELLETGANARRTLEALRDRLFNVKGLRWVFCGANGVIHALAASPRLAAYLNTPILDVGHVQPSAIRPLIQARYAEFAMKDQADVEQCLPLRLQDLEALYKIANYNLRHLLSLADEYCDLLHSTRTQLATDEQKAKRFVKWLDKHTVETYSNLASRLPADAWVILDLVMSDDYKGTFGVGDFDALNQNSLVTLAKSTFEKRLRDLLKHGIISKSIEDDGAGSGSGDDEFKREVFTVTSKGSLVHYARLIKQENQGIKPLTWLKRVHA